MLTNSSTLAVSVPINISIKLGFVSINDSQGNLLCVHATYFTNWKHLITLIQESSTF